MLGEIKARDGESTRGEGEMNFGIRIVEIGPKRTGQCIKVVGLFGDTGNTVKPVNRSACALKHP